MVTELSIIIPAYNEEHRISPTLEYYIDYFRDFDIEIIIVLNGCRDNTLDVVSLYKQNHPKIVKIINIPEAIGKGAAVREGFAISTGLVVGFIDADGATSPQEFHKLVKVTKRHDGAIASRWISGSKVQGRTALRSIISLMYIVLVKSIFTWGYVDTQCGAKVFNKTVIDHVLPMMTVSNMAFDVELLYLCKKNNFRVIEVPTTWVDKEASPSFGSPLRLITTGINMLYTLIKIRLTSHNVI